VHITFTHPVAETLCYGGTGVTGFPASDITKFCPGNNQGTFAWMDVATGQMHSVNFDPGDATMVFIRETDPLSLDIDSFSGDHPC
jgi:hypothetical protein